METNDQGSARHFLLLVISTEKCLFSFPKLFSLEHEARFFIISYTGLMYNNYVDN